MFPDESKSDLVNEPHVDPWHAQIPNVFRWLNGQREQPFTRGYPAVLFDAAFWSAPYYIMRGLLGWRDVAAGVAHQLTEAFGVSGPAEVLRTAWDEAVLGSIGWWSWTHPQYQCEPSQLFAKLGYPARFAQIAEWNGFVGGFEPHHLTGHIWNSSSPDGDPIATIVSEKSKNAAIIIDVTESLRGSLEQLSPRIPDVRAPWNVHATSREHGYLGSFRRCTQCKRWFQGPFAPHSWGHAPGE